MTSTLNQLGIDLSSPIGLLDGNSTARELRLLASGVADNLSPKGERVGLSAELRTRQEALRRHLFDVVVPAIAAKFNPPSAGPVAKEMYGS